LCRDQRVHSGLDGQGLRLPLLLLRDPPRLCVRQLLPDQLHFRRELLQLLRRQLRLRSLLLEGLDPRTQRLELAADFVRPRIARASVAPRVG
jgi:hypothetical protein